MKNNKSLIAFFQEMSEHYGRKADEAGRKANFWLVMIFLSVALSMFLILI